MTLFKDLDGNVHDDMDGAATYLLPIGCVEITKKEAENILKKQTNIVYVPQSISMRQARRALLSIGKLSQVDGLIDSLPEPQRSETKIDWETSSEVLRAQSFVTIIGSALGLSDDDLDALFIEAVKL